MPPGIRKLCLRPKNPSLHPAPDESSNKHWNGVAALAFEKRRLSDLRISENHPRDHDKHSIKQVCRAIQSLRVFFPILIAKDGEIIDGVKRYLAATRLGLDEIPVFVVDHLSDVQRKALGVFIHRSQEKARWKFEALKLTLEEIQLHEPELLTFDELFFEGQLHSCANISKEDGILEPQALAVSQVGDVWQCGEHRQGCWDIRDAVATAALLAGQGARLCIADVPYNVAIVGNVSEGAHREFAMASSELSPDQYAALLVEAFQTTHAVLTLGALVYAFIDWRHISALVASAESAGLTLFQMPIWTKPVPAKGSFYRSAHELVPVFKYGSAAHTNNIMRGKNGRHRSNVWAYPGASSLHSDAREALEYHPTPKPLQMIKDILLDASRRGDVVFDGFAGSGTTLLACESLGRVYRGVEIDPLYVDVIVRRWQAQTGRQATLLATGETFDALAVSRSVAAPNTQSAAKPLRRGR